MKKPTILENIARIRRLQEFYEEEPESAAICINCKAMIGWAQYAQHCNSHSLDHIDKEKTDILKAALRMLVDINIDIDKI